MLSLSDIIQGNLTLNSRGLKNPELLREIQEKLINLGYNPGIANGEMNFKTKAALIQFCLERQLDCIEQDCYDVGFALKLCGGRVTA